MWVGVYVFISTLMPSLMDPSGYGLKKYTEMGLSACVLTYCLLSINADAFVVN